MTTGERLTASKAAKVALGLRNSTHEYAALLDGNPAPEPYDQLAVEPTMSLSHAELEALLDVTPLYESCSWPPKPHRLSPRFIRETIHTHAVGTDHEAVLAGPHHAMTKLGIQDETSITEFVGGWLAEVGYTSKLVSDRSCGEPQYWGHPHDDDGPVVIVDPDRPSTDPVFTSAGELIMAANRARRAGSHLLVITPSSETARWAREVLTVPYARRRGDAFQLYTAPSVVRTARGEIVVVARRSAPLYWTVSSDGCRSLYHGDRCLASGSATTPIASYPFEMPRLTTRDGSRVIETADGELREHVASLEACANDYRVAYRPVLPIRPLFCADLTVAYRAGSSLREPIFSPRHLDKSRLQTWKDHRNRALADFLETYTQRTGAASTAQEFVEHFRAWYDAQTTGQTPSSGFVEYILSQVRRSEITNTGALTRHSWWSPDMSDLPLSLAHGRATGDTGTSNHSKTD